MKWAVWVASFGVHYRHGHVFFAKSTTEREKLLREGYCRITSFLCGSCFDLFIFSSPVHLHGLVPVSTVGTARTYVRFGLVV
jgi:hypothetical protein